MYTEENEFDYNEYQDYNGESYDNYEESNNKKWSTNKSIIIKGILILLAIIAIIALVYFYFFNKKDSPDNSNIGKIDPVLVFNANISKIREAAEVFFFDSGNITEDTTEITLQTLINETSITEIKDENDKACSYSNSKITLTKNTNDYKMEIFLSCDDIEDTYVYYYDMNFQCLTCNGEGYDPNNNEEPKEDDSKKTEYSCSEWSPWTDELIENNKLSRQERTLVIGSKKSNLYGNWSEWSKTTMTGNTNLEVETKTEIETSTTTETSEWSEEKPENKDNREIESKKESTTTYKQSCSNKTVTTYKELSYRDTSAKACWASSTMGKYECQYVTTKKVCESVPKTTKTTYYRYTDTIITTVDVIYYRSRTISLGDTVYTDYILEEDMPSGYEKVAGSDKKQYSYKEICNAK